MSASCMISLVLQVNNADDAEFATELSQIATVLTDRMSQKHKRRKKTNNKTENMRPDLALLEIENLLRYSYPSNFHGC